MRSVIGLVGPQLSVEWLDETRFIRNHWLRAVAHAIYTHIIICLSDTHCVLGHLAAKETIKQTKKNKTNKQNKTKLSFNNNKTKTNERENKQTNKQKNPKQKKQQQQQKTPNPRKKAKQNKKAKNPKTKIQRQNKTEQNKTKVLFALVCSSRCSWPIHCDYLLTASLFVSVTSRSGEIQQIMMTRPLNMYDG